MIWCLLSACLFAISLTMYRAGIREFGPSVVNLYKCAFAALLFFGWAAIFVWDFSGTSGEWIAMALSGVVGFAIGDSLLFLAIREGGVQRALVLFNSAPLIATVLAIPIYGEIPTAGVIVGITILMLGVVAVETDPARRHDGDSAARGRAFLVLAAGIGAAAGQAGGILLSRGPIQQLELVPATAVRLGAGAIGVAVLIWLVPRRRESTARLVRSPRWLIGLSLPAFIGTFLGVLFMMRGIRAEIASISSALLATTPIFSLPLAAYFLRERLGVASVLGTLLAVAGVIVIEVFR